MSFSSPGHVGDDCCIEKNTERAEDFRRGASGCGLGCPVWAPGALLWPALRLLHSLLSITCPQLVHLLLLPSCKKRPAQETVSTHLLRNSVF